MKASSKKGSSVIKAVSTKVLALSLTAACALAACQGAHSASTLPWAQTADSIGGLTAGAIAPERLESRLPDCSLATAPIPGTYVFMNSIGNVSGSKYQQTRGDWAMGTVRVAASPSPMPSGGPPTPTQKTYLYVGKYRLKTAGQTGCVYLETTLKGEPFRESKYNASFAGIPDFDTLNFSFDVKRGGQLSMTVGQLGPAGGRGTLQLLRHQTVYDTGTIVFSKRILHRGP
jgi:hypothetical protein